MINIALRRLLLLATGHTLCVCVCACWCQVSEEHSCAVGQISGRQYSYFCLKYIHCTTAEAKPTYPRSPCAPSQKKISPVCLSASLYLCICVWQRERECEFSAHSDFWGRPRPVKRSKVEKDSRALCTSRRLLRLPRWQIGGVDIFLQPAIIFTVLPTDSSCYPEIL